MSINRPDHRLTIAHQQHGRHWRDFLYCYPVVSRRSGGLSVGINLNPDKACNFDCVYCQVDRSAPPLVRKVDLAVLREELDRLLGLAVDQSLFTAPPFDCLPPDERVVRDLAFSGDGEPTTYPHFDEAVRIAAEVKRARGLAGAKLVLITDACYLTKPTVREALQVLDENHGEIWAKLDAGTQSYYEQVNRPNYPLAHVLENILDAARVRPVVIQSLWMRLHDRPAPEEEVRAFAGRLTDILAGGGRIKLVQVYTIARRTAESFATPLAREELDRTAALVRTATNLPIETFYGTGE